MLQLLLSSDPCSESLDITRPLAPPSLLHVSPRTHVKGTPVLVGLGVAQLGIHVVRAPSPLFVFTLINAAQVTWPWEPAGTQDRGMAYAGRGMTGKFTRRLDSFLK